jgi:hypothetical protein
MSQVFAGDSVNNTTATTLVTTATTPAVTGNFLNPPFGNAKAIVSATVNITYGTGTNSVVVAIRRNPNAENVVVGVAQTNTATAGNFANLGFTACDVIPDGRQVQYQVGVAQGGATGNGTINFANVSVLLISG